MTEARNNKLIGVKELVNSQAVDRTYMELTEQVVLPKTGFNIYPNGLLIRHSKIDKARQVVVPNSLQRGDL